jgi:hypothetical protein
LIARLDYIVDIKHERARAGISNPTIDAFMIALCFAFTPLFPHIEIGVSIKQVLVANGIVGELKLLLKFLFDVIEFGFA